MMLKKISQSRFVFLLAGLTLFAAGCALLEAPASVPATTVTAFPTVAPPSSATTFDNNTLAGQPAAAFTLPDANGQPYDFQPNNGRKHLVVFYMVYT